MIDSEWCTKNAILRDDDRVDRSNVRMNRCVCVRNDYDRHMSQSWNTDGFAEDKKYDFPVVIIFYKSTVLKLLLLLYILVYIVLCVGGMPERTSFPRCSFVLDTTASTG